MKEFIKILGWILLFAVLYFKGCDPQTITKTKEVTKLLPSKTKIQHDTIIKYREFVKNNLSNNDKSEIDYLNKRIQEYQDENNDILDDYQKETDSLKKLLLFKNAIALKSFSSDFEDEYINISINGIVAGEVKEITPKYTIKPFDGPTKKRKVSFLYGGGISGTKNIDNFSVNAGVGLQNKSGGIILVNYNTQNQIGVSYYKSLGK